MTFIVPGWQYCGWLRGPHRIPLRGFSLRRGYHRSIWPLSGRQTGTGRGNSNLPIERLARGRHEPPRSRTLEQANESPSACAPRGRHVDARHRKRLHRWIDRRRVAFHRWKQAAPINGSRRWQDRSCLFIERDCKHRTAVARGRAKPARVTPCPRRMIRA
jgi:hypothetical protein